MDWWSVSVEARSDGMGLIDDDALDKLLDLMQPYSGGVIVGAEPPRWSATISLEAESAAEAVAEGVRVVTTLATDAGLALWPIARAEAIRADVLDDDLPAPPTG